MMIELHKDFNGKPVWFNKDFITVIEPYDKESTYVYSIDGENAVFCVREKASEIVKLINQND